MEMRNHEGYQNPTVCKAIRHVYKKRKKIRNNTAGLHLTFQILEIKAFYNCIMCLHDVDI